MMDAPRQCITINNSITGTLFWGGDGNCQRKYWKNRQYVKEILFKISIHVERNDSKSPKKL
jgi:hypothetical protein